MNWPSLIMAFLVLVLPGLCLIRKAVQMIVLGRRSMTWPATKGKVLSAGIKEFEAKSRDIYTLYPNIEYTYTVDGIIQKSRGLSTAMWRLSFRSARNFTENYTPGKEVTVHYDPKNPSRAVLEPGLKLIPVLFTGVIFLGGGLIALYLEATGQMR